MWLWWFSPFKQWLNVFGSRFYAGFSRLNCSNWTALSTISLMKDHGIWEKSLSVSLVFIWSLRENHIRPFSTFLQPYPSTHHHPRFGIPVSTASWIMRKLAGITTVLAQVTNRRNSENMSFTGICPVKNTHPTVGPEGQRLMSAFWFGGMRVRNTLSLLKT